MATAIGLARHAIMKGEQEGPNLTLEWAVKGLSSSIEMKRMELRIKRGREENRTLRMTLKAPQAEVADELVRLREENRELRFQVELLNLADGIEKIRADLAKEREQREGNLRQKKKHTKKD